MNVPIWAVLLFPASVWHKPAVIPGLSLGNHGLYRSRKPWSISYEQTLDPACDLYGVKKIMAFGMGSKLCRGLWFVSPEQ